MVLGLSKGNNSPEIDDRSPDGELIDDSFGEFFCCSSVLDPTFWLCDFDLLDVDSIGFGDGDCDGLCCKCEVCGTLICFCLGKSSSI